MKKSILFLSLILAATFAYADYPSYHGVPGKYDTYITAFGELELQDLKFFIEPADENISPDDLEFKEYASYVAAYFVMWGAKQVDDIKDADVFILADFGIGETKPLVYHRPIYGNTGVASQRTTYYKNSSYTSYSYSHGVVGYDTKEVDQYRKYINLHAYKLENEKNPTPVWKAEIVCTSSGSSLAKAIPVMMWNVRYWIGEKTDGASRQFPCSLSGHEWADIMEYNHFSKFISQGKGTTWHGLGTGWTFWGKTAKTLLFPSVLYNGDDYTDIIFFCPIYDIANILSTTSEYKIPSDTYIEYNGKRYKATKAFGCELDKKKKYDWNQRTFTIRFERIPDDVIRNRISIYSDVKGKHKYGWEKIHIY